MFMVSWFVLSYFRGLLSMLALCGVLVISIDDLCTCTSVVSFYLSLMLFNVLQSPQSTPSPA